MKFKSHRFGALAAACAAVALGSGIAYASIPDSNGTIHTCMTNGARLLRVIDSPSETCKPGETPLDIAQGLSNPHVVVIGQVDATPDKLMTARCPQGERATGGGFRLNVPTLADGKLPLNSPVVQTSIAAFSTHALEMAHTPDEWVVEATAQEGFDEAWGLDVSVDCVKLGP
jgi:hypothetical protein